MSKKTLVEVDITLHSGKEITIRCSEQELRTEMSKWKRSLQGITTQKNDLVYMDFGSCVIETGQVAMMNWQVAVDR